MSTREGAVNITERQTHVDYFLELLENRTLSEIIGESIALFLVDFVSLVGNLLLCLVTYRIKTLQTVTNVFILSLALSDILMAVVCMPLSLAVLIQGNWIFSMNACRMQCFLIYYFAFGSLQTITVIAINRYYRVLKPTKYRKIFKFKTTIFISLIVWVGTAVFLSIPFLAGAIESNFSPSKAACVIFTKPGTRRQAVIAVNVALVSVAAIIPTFVVSYCYFRVFKAVGHHFVRVRPTLKTVSSTNNNQSPAGISEIKSTRILFFVLLAYFICWLPVFTIESLQTFFLKWWAIPRSGHLLWTFCGCLSSAVNPVVFLVTSRTFRRELKNLILFKRRGSTTTISQTRRASVFILNEQTFNAIERTCIQTVRKVSVHQINGKQ